MKEEKYEGIKERVRSSLKNDNYISIQKKIAKYIGYLPAIYLHDLIWKEEYFEKRGQLTKDEEFFNIQSDIEKTTFFPPYFQSKIIKILKVVNFISVRKGGGIPAKNYFKINFEKIEEILSLKIDCIPCVYCDWSAKNSPIFKQEKNDNDYEIINVEFIDEKGNKKPSIFKRKRGKKTIASDSDVKMTSDSDVKMTSDSDVKMQINNNLNINESKYSSFFKLKKEEYIEKSPEEDFSDTTSPQESLPVRKFKRPPIETKQKPSLKENNKRYEEIGNKLRLNINNKIAAEKPMKPKAVPQQRVPEEIVDIMDLWHQLGFKKINPEKAPKTFNKTVSALKKIQKGTLIPGEKRKFSIEEIKDAIVKYSLIALDPEYGPDNPEMKKAMGSKSLEAFLYCPGFGSKGNKVLSWCVKCIDDPPLSKKTTIENVEEKYPRITKIFKRFYCDHVLCGMNKKFSANDESKFKKAANRIGDAYFKLDRVLHGVRDPEHLASLFCQSVAKSFGTNISKIYPGSMGSDFAIERLLAFLQEKEMIENRAKENFNKIF